MVFHVLRTKLISERILLHVVKGLPIQGRANTVPLMQDSLTFGCLPGTRSSLYREAQSESVLIRGRRNFSSGPLLSKNIPKMNLCKKSSSAFEAETNSSLEGQCKYDCPRCKINKLVYRAHVFGLWSVCLSSSLGIYSSVQLNSAGKILDDLK